MKKYFLFTAILTISIIAIFSCRKSFDSENNQIQVMNPSSETEVKIQSFLNRLQSDLKDEKAYSIDSAIWYSTASLNYTYAIYDSSLLHVSLDTSTFSVYLDENDRVPETELESVIELMVDSLEVIFENLPNNTKHVMYCMVFEISTNESRLDMGLVSAIAWGYSSTFYGSFSETEDWYSIWQWGDCYYFTLPGDATDQLEYKLMHPLVVSDPDWRIFTLPSETYTTDYIWPVDYPYTPSPRGFRGFTVEDEGDWDGPHCLQDEELNFYLSANGIPFIIDDNQPMQEGLEFIAIDIDGDVAFPMYGYAETHFYTISYAPKHKTLVPASSL